MIGGKLKTIINNFCNSNLLKLYHFMNNATTMDIPPKQTNLQSIKGYHYIK